MRQRSITAFFFGLAMFGGIYGGREAFFALGMLIAGGCLWELQRMLLPETERFRRLRLVMGTAMGLIPVAIAGLYLLLGGFCGLSMAEEIVAAHREHHQLALEMSFLALFLLTPIWLATELFLESKSPFQHLGISWAGIFYLSIPIALMFSLATPNGLYAPNRIVALLVLVWSNDVGAYLIGSRWGKHKLLERISPKKTWEGTLGGALMALVVALGLAQWLPEIAMSTWLLLGGIAALGSNLGDLAESMLKRSVGVKDSGNILPGHGGFLDRFDAFIFCLPFYWLLLTLFGSLYTA